MGQSLYATWKRDIVVEAFRQRGLSPDVAALVTVAAGSRRRATFTAGRTDGGLRFGYHARASHTLVDIARCPVLAPPIEAALPALKAICALLLAGRGGRGGGRSAARQLRVHVTLARGGLDVAMSRVDDAATVGRARTAPNRQAHQRKSATEPPHIDSGTRQAIAARAEAARILRLSLDGELVLAGPAPLIALSGVDVLLPEATFLQAVAEAEASMIRLVLDGVGAPRGTSRGRGRVADLFCGLGPFTFALARTRPVLAMDSDAAAIAALTAASRQAQGLKPIEARRRDLYQEPLAARELAGFDAVVLDPPRAGASAQVAALAESDVARVVMVSCNPATLARDVRTLVDGGYQLGTVTPIDQFVYAPHVEVVAVLTRPS